MKSLYNEEYLDLYRALLADVKGMEADGATAFQFCRCGKDYIANSEKRFMVVGRAINGWDDNIGKCIETEMSSVTESDNVLNFIDKYGSGSAFWRVTRDVIENLGLTGADNWYDNLAWNNLYKVAPFERGNPKEKVCQAQFKLCNKILKYEINALQPKYILLITGYWFGAFNDGVYNRKIEVETDDRLGFNINCDNSDENSIVIGATSTKLNGFSSKIVLCHRPEARKGGEEKSKKEIIEAFEGLKCAISQ